MKKIAIVYATKHGQTEKIARYMEDRLQQRGLSTQIINTGEATPLSSEVDGVIYGAPVYRSQFPKSIVAWVKKNRATLSRMPTALFTVSLNAADKRPEAREADRMLIRSFIDQSGFAPGLTTSIAGACKYRDYYWPVRLLMKRISRLAGGETDTSRNHEYTSWPKVDAFLTAFQNVDAKNPSIVNLAGRRGLGESNSLPRSDSDQVVLKTPWVNSENNVQSQV
jgi:menaquinone-dependent protoporphyrinogen oxidase